MEAGNGRSGAGVDEGGVGVLSAVAFDPGGEGKDVGVVVGCRDDRLVVGSVKIRATAGDRIGSGLVDERAVFMGAVAVVPVASSSFQRSTGCMSSDVGRSIA